MRAVSGQFTITCGIHVACKLRMQCRLHDRRRTYERPDFVQVSSVSGRALQRLGRTRNLQAMSTVQLFVAWCCTPCRLHMHSGLRWAQRLGMQRLRSWNIQEFVRPPRMHDVFPGKVFWGAGWGSRDCLRGMSDQHDIPDFGCSRCKLMHVRGGVPALDRRRSLSGLSTWVFQDRDR